MANNDGKNDQSHETATRFPYTEVSEAENVAPLATWQQNMMESGGNSTLAQEVARRGNEGAAKQRQGGSLDPQQRDASQHSGLQQSHQQTEQSKDTRAYAEHGEAASLSALQKDQAQLKDGQRLNRGHTRDQDREKTQEQSQQQGKEKANEQQKTQGR